MKKTKHRRGLAGLGRGLEALLADPPEADNPIAARLRQLQGMRSAADFARACGIGESLMRLYLRGTMPGADKAAQIAVANGVSVDWLTTGKGKGPDTGQSAKLDAVDRALDQRLTALRLLAIIEPIEEELGSQHKLSSKAKARLIAVATRIYMGMRPEERDKGFNEIIKAVIDILLNRAM